MSSKFRDDSRNQLFLFPPSVQEWLPEDHLARFIVDIVSQLDLSKIRREYTVRGSQAYQPEMMVALLFYGYSTGVFSSRSIERSTYDSIPFRYVSANTHPDHATISTFRKRFIGELKIIFVQILKISSEMGFLKLGNVSIDGTKIHANASKHKALSWGHAKKLEAKFKKEIKQLLLMAAKVDKKDLPDELSIPKELSIRKERLAVIAQAKAELEKRAAARYEEEKEQYAEKMEKRRNKEIQTGKKISGKEPKEPEPGPKKKDQINLTDDESRIMLTTHGFEQCYNAQAITEIDSFLIIENHISQNPNDKKEVAPALTKLLELPPELGKIKNLLADNGYFSEHNVTLCDQAVVIPYISVAREQHNQSLSERFSSPSESPSPTANAVEKMKHRLQTIEGKAIYSRRKCSIETVFGMIKQGLGFRQFLLRGCEAVSGEWNLLCIAHNLKRMHSMAQV